MSFIENIHIEDEIYHILLRLLQNKTGLDFAYYRRSHIEKRIKARMIRVRCTTLESYYNYLFSNDDEFRKFVETFTINYTFFFRDWEIYDIFKNILLRCLNYKKDTILSNIRPKPSQLANFRTEENYLKNLAKKKKFYNAAESIKNLSDYINSLSLYQKIRRSRSSLNEIKIWSSPCASGEEPYTIAMILDNLSKQIPNFPKFKIIASDIDNDSIIYALTGIYKEDSMKEITDYFKNKYFTKIKRRYGNEYLINEELKYFIEFINEDLTKVHGKSNKYDVIFCRYLLIYFNRENRNKFLNNMLSHLNFGGLLILGKTETLFNDHEKLKIIDQENQIYLKN